MLGDIIHGSSKRLVCRVARSLEIFSRTFCLNRYGGQLSWVSAEGQNMFSPLWKLGLRTRKMLENLKPASRFRLIDLILAITLYLPVWQSHCTKASLTVLAWFKNFQGRQKIFKDNKTFSKNEGHNKLWQQIEGQFLGAQGRLATLLVCLCKAQKFFTSLRNVGLMLLVEKFLNNGLWVTSAVKQSCWQAKTEFQLQTQEGLHCRNSLLVRIADCSNMF